jgi:uncharacterized membrane protein
MSTDLLASIPLFAKLPANERAELTKLLQLRRYPANQPIFWIGEKGDEFFIVQRGHVTVTCPDETGKEVMLGTLGPGHFFGEISLLDGGPRTATVRAHSDIALLCLGRDNFLEFLRQNPQAAVHMLTILGTRQRETVEKVRGIRNVNEAVAQQRTRWHLIAERVAMASASEWFVTLNVAFFGFWIIANLFMQRMNRIPFDAAPFSLLGFIITVEALFISLFVLITQSQQGQRDRIRADLDYQVNLKAHQEVMQLHQKIDRLEATVRATGADISPPASPLSDEIPADDPHSPVS